MNYFLSQYLFHNNFLDKGNQVPDSKYECFSQALIWHLATWFGHNTSESSEVLKGELHSWEPQKAKEKNKKQTKEKISHHRPKEACQLTVPFGYQSANTHL